MTLIVTAIGEGCLYQVSDMQLTDEETGIIYEERSIKTTAVTCNNGSLMLSYTGAAKLSGTRTEDVIFDLSPPDLQLMTVDQYLQFFLDGLNFKFANILKRGIHIIFVGWENNNDKINLFYGSLSNSEQSGVVLNKISEYFALEKYNTKKATLVINGAQTATCGKNTERYIKKAANLLQNNKSQPGEIRSTIIKIIRTASRSPKGSSIGKNIISSIMKFGSSEIEVRYHAKDATIRQYGCNLMTMGIRMKDVFYSTDPNDFQS